MTVSVGGRRVPLGVGATAGAVAWLVGYLLTYAVTSGPIRQFQESFLGRVVDLFGVEIATWKVVGWVYFNAHFVSTVAGRGNAGNAIGGESGFTVLLYVVPPLVLLVAGLAAGRATGVAHPGDGVVTGATVLVGYLSLTVLAVFVFGTTVADATVGPDPLSGVFLAGVLYPAVFGAVGAGLAGVTAEGGGETALQV